MAKPPVKAQHIADQLAEQIRNGEPAPGGWLPTERELGETYGAGRSTVRLAIQLLADAGLVERRGGAGARVVTPGPESAPLDAAAVHGELSAIRAELAEMNERLRALEDRDIGAGESVR
jgi:DNA-binding GntR family transcriptional regulator